MTDSHKNPWKNAQPGRPMIAPSLLACDFTRLGDQIIDAMEGSADVIHVDIMDGHFVPNLSIGVPIVKSIRKHFNHAMDVHIMVTDPAYFLERFAEAGASSITFHLEACGEVGSIKAITAEEGKRVSGKALQLIKRLRELGLGAGICLRPGTPAEALVEVAPAVDMVLVMTVEPGYGGQKFIEPMLNKISAVRAQLRPEQRLEVDGGINPLTAHMCAQHGTDVFVAGENIFGCSSVAGAIHSLRAAAEDGHNHPARGGA